MAATIKANINQPSIRADISSGGTLRVNITSSIVKTTTSEIVIRAIIKDRGAQGPQGETGATGAAGADGADGQGVPIGGTTGQVLAKNSDTDFDTEWIDSSGLGDMLASVYDPQGIVDDAFDQDNMTDGATNKNFTATEKTKLAGIEALADVTDAGNVGSTIHGSTGKTTPVNADELGIIDTEASNVLKKLTFTNLKAFLKTYFDTLYAVTLGSDDNYVTDAEKVKLSNLSGTNTGDQTSVTGNAGTATALQTARNIDGQSFDGTSSITVIAPGTHAASSKSTPVDADEIPLVDSAASNVLKKLTWANTKATLKTYFDGIYQAAGSYLTASSTDTLTNKTIDANGTGNSISNLEVADLASGVLDTDLSSVAGTDTTIPSAKATKTALDLKAPLASPTFTGTVTLPTGLTGVIRTDSGVVSVDSDVTDIVSAASDTAAGKVELATTAETTTGTDATRAVTPDGLHDMTSLSGAAWFLDEDDMVSDSATKTSSQQSIKAYVDAQIGGGGYTDEMAQDAVGAMIADTATIDLTYTDGTPELKADVKDASITYAKIQNVSATDKLLGRSTAGAGVVEEIPLTAAGRALIDDADASAQRTTLGLVIGTNVQAYDAELAAIAGLTSAADKGIQFTGSGTAGTFDLTTAGKALLDDANAAAQIATLGLDADIATLSLPASTTISAFSKTFLDDADEATFKATVNLEANTDFYAPGGTDVAVADGGTGSSTAAGAATNLGLGTGDSPQFTAVNIGHASDTTITRTGAGDIAVEGNGLYRAGGTDVAIADGGTGASTAAAAIAALGGLPTAGGTMTGNITLGENASVALDPAGSADGKYTGITITATAGYTQAFGDLVYLDPTDSRWEATDANSAAGADGDARGILGIVVSAGTDGNACTILLHGVVRADAKFPSFTINNPIYVSETSGLVTQTQPTTTDVVIRVVGSALTADEMYFNPSYDYITHT